MFGTKAQFIVGLTTYYTENLNISVRALARLNKNFILIVHADNPEQKVTKKQIRALGYKGTLYIINSQYNVGTLNARLAIMNTIRERKLNADWTVFVDDDDILTNLDTPNVSPENFAIVQNMVVLRTRLIDVLRVMNNPKNYTVDNENVFLVRPHVGITGTMVRTDMAMRMADAFNNAMQEISDINERLTFRAPVDMIMWSALNIVAQHYNPNAKPIYMDNINYIASDIDTATTKYGVRLLPGKNAKQQIEQTINKYNAAIRNALTAAAAPVGHD
ncbi:MAG: hypothetical protein IJY99_02545 [Alphaproteobacteria bacterium]|nr:hypothetical protein [Alphaproteobacteria bacterium]